jgi:hypothetical protein
VFCAKFRDKEWDRWSTFASCDYQDLVWFRIKLFRNQNSVVAMGRIACCLALLAVYLTAGALATETTVRGAAPGAASRHRELWGTEWSFANLMCTSNVRGKAQ